MIRWCLFAAAGLAIACSGSARPIDPELGHEACAQCRMVIVSKATAAQIIVDGDPLFFDEIRCLRDYRARATLSGQPAVFVADHRTGEWVAAEAAVFTRTSLATPMASGLLAHANTASRDADPDASGGQSVPAAEILGPVRRTP